MGARVVAKRGACGFAGLGELQRKAMFSPSGDKMLKPLLLRKKEAIPISEKISGVQVPRTLCSATAQT